MKQFLIFALFSLIFFACSRDKATWDVDILGPVAQTVFMINDLIPDSILYTNSDDNLVLSFRSELLNLKADTLLSLNDTTYGDNFTVPPPFSSLLIAPGLPFPASLSNIDLNTGSDILMNEGVICTGNLSIQMINPLETSLEVTYIVPGLSNNGEVFSVVQTLDPAEANVPSITSLDIDVSNYDVDLTGVDGLSQNELAQSISIINSIDGDTVLATLFDTLKLNIDLQNLTFLYAKGYFGSYDIVEESGITLENNFGIQSGNILINEASIDLEIRNGVGVDFRIYDAQYNAVNSNSSVSLAMDNSTLGENLNVNRAIDSENGPIYSTKTIHLDQSNSNITDIVALAPDSINIVLNLAVNPLGNSSSNNDFIYKDEGIIINADLEMPLCLTVNDLELMDTLQFNFSDEIDGSLDNGMLTIYAENTFPFDIAIDLSIIESGSSELIVENQFIAACIDDGVTCISSNSELLIPLTGDQIEKLKNGGQLTVSGIFNSDGEIKLQPHQKIKLQAVIDAKMIMGL